MGADVMVRLEGVTKRFGNIWALRGIDLELQRGRWLSIFGPNGAGKTTLLKIVSTLTAPSAGSVSIAGYDALREGERVRPLLGVLGHRTFLYGHLTAVENLAFYARMFALTGDTGRVAEVLHAVGLEAYGRQLVRTYSRGMQQRLAIARALLHHPPLLLLDEPYTGLDQQATMRLQELLRQLRAADHTIIVSTHDLRLGLMLSDDIAIQCRGRMVYRGLAADMDARTLEQLYFDHVK